MRIQFATIVVAVFVPSVLDATVSLDETEAIEKFELRGGRVTKG